MLYRYDKKTALKIFKNKEISTINFYWFKLATSVFRISRISRTGHSQIFFKTGFFKEFGNIQSETPEMESLFNKIEGGLQLYFPLNIAILLSTTFMEHLQCLLFNREYGTSQAFYLKIRNMLVVFYCS